MFDSFLGHKTNGSAYDEALRQVQLNQYNQMNVINSQPNQALIEIQKITQDLTQDEQILLGQEEEFVMVKAQYENIFMGYLSNKFGVEFSTTPTGAQANEALLEVLKRTVNKVRKTASEEKNKIAELASLLKSDPDIINKLKAVKEKE